MARKPMTPAIIRLQVVLEELDVAPDGRFAVVARRFVDRQDRYASQLWFVPLVRGLGRTRALTSGPVHDGRPRISPDARRVAFRRTRLETKGAVATLEILDLAGRGTRPGKADPADEPWTVVAPVHGVVELAWSPGGNRLAYTAEAGPERFTIPEARGRTVSAPSDPDRAPLGRRIRRADWRWDEQGHVDRWEHLFVVPARPDRRARRLTRGDWGVRQASWDPGGRSLVFVADRTASADLYPHPTVWRVGLDGAPPAELLALGGPASHPAISPDGRWLAVVGVIEADALDDISPGIVIAPADGSGPAMALAPGLDRPIGWQLDTDLVGWQATSRGGPLWAGRDRLIALVSDRGRCVAWQFELDSGTGRNTTAEPRPIARADAACEHLAISSDGRTVVLVGTLDGRAPEVMTADQDGPRTRTRIGSAWQARVRQPDMRLITLRGPGARSMSGWPPRRVLAGSPWRR